MSEGSYIFQSTLPRGERRVLLQVSMTIQEFQSTLPRGERRLHDRTNERMHRFQSTLPRGERHHPDEPPKCHFHFNPRSHEGSDRGSLRVILALRISIHAPTRGATPEGYQDYRYPIISIHAPTRGATAKIPNFQLLQVFLLWYK